MAARLKIETQSRAQTFRARLRILPWWLKVAVIYLLSRIVTTIIFILHAATEPGVNGATGNMGYLEYANVWDAKWFFWIAYYGYPTHLPLDAAGDVTQNAWAFMPVYPFVTRAFAAASGTHWYFWSIFVSVLAGLISALLIDRLFVKKLGSLGAIFAVTVFCFMPLSPLFQVGYAESLGLMLLLIVMYLLINRYKALNYWMLYPAILLASLTRPLGVAIALMLFIIWCSLLWKHRMRSLTQQDFRRITAVGLFAALSGVLWAVIAGVVTGRIDAYTQTEISWRKAYVNADGFVPFEGWWQGLDWWFDTPLAVLLYILMLLVLLLLVMLVKRFGIEMTAWTVAYPLYLFAVFFPQSSTWRLLIPLFTWVGLPALIRSWLGRVMVILLCILGQWFWLHYCWHIGANTWVVP
ncbi:MAG: hypothetical protein KF916_00970 [Microbacteriaceae bacterium]|nr:hypothetical protein [Microbacteriaceae bacterium]